MDFLDTFQNDNWVINLPYDLLWYISTFTNINSLLNTCSQLHQLKELKRSKFKNDCLVKKYCNNSKFKQKIDKCTNIYQLNPMFYKMTDVSKFKNINTVQLYECHNVTDFSALENVRSLTITLCSSIDVNTLGHMYKLKLFHCDNITDVSALRDVPNLTITRCDGITDVSALRDVPNLTITECPNITW